MGSIEKACISGFLCRLCSEMHRTVIHIYSDHGQRLCLVEKINGYLPITISPTDPLPKTICKTCLHRVEQHYSLLMRLTRLRREHRNKFLNATREDVGSSISSVYEEEDHRPRESSRTSPSEGTSVQGQGTSGAGPSNRDPDGAGPSNRDSKENRPSTRNQNETGNQPTNQELT
ncbi:uncharacterized protein Dana_GF17108 [Drosophila ananassae]|uniref:ZAD domain-containing protein n=1 Tax=Drosophila ananassae TaxID=7217 RepID=B3M1Y0_DROAN|nr:uncharacterized protein LOC6499896 [Drosophila ananassae]EDV42240.1 uncharacterized protein Dana_GF17108 [Drosophila ananassae]